MPEDTDPKTHAAKARHLTPWCFQPGQSGNPAGRPLGARNRLAETFLEDIYAVWRQHGRKAVEKLAIEEGRSTPFAPHIPHNGYEYAIVGSEGRHDLREGTKGAQLNVGPSDHLADMLEAMQGDGIKQMC